MKANIVNDYQKEQDRIKENPALGYKRLPYSYCDYDCVEKFQDGDKVNFVRQRHKSTSGIICTEQIKKDFPEYKIRKDEVAVDIGDEDSNIIVLKRKNIFKVEE